MKQLITALILLAPLALTAPAEAAPKKKKEAAAAPVAPANPIEGDLGKLKWGMTVEEVKNTFHEKIEDNYKEKSKGVRDVTLADSLSKQKKQELATFDASYKKFDTQADIGKLSVSIISNELQAGVNESMLIIRDDKSTRYLFFTDEKLVKLFVAYDGAYLGDLSFADFTAKIQAKHGEPKQKYNRKVQTETLFVACNWGDTTANLWVEDKRDVYGSVVLIYETPTARQIAREKQIEPPKTKSKYGVDDNMIDNLGVAKNTPPPVEAKPADTKATTKTDPKKDDKKKKAFDPLEGLKL